MFSRVNERQAREIHFFVRQVKVEDNR